MIYTSINTITRSILIKKSLPIHYYMRFLKFVCDAIRELSFDTLKVVNSVTLTINCNGNYATLPADYVDYTLIGIPKGQFIQPAVNRDSITRLPNYNTTGQIIDYGIPENSIDFPFFPGFFMFQTIDDLGENVGRLYGYNTGYLANSYSVIKERGVIQFDENFPSPTCALQYIGNGQSANSATQIDPLAQACVEAFADHQWELHKIKAQIGMIELKEREFGKQWRLLRARLGGYTVDDIRQALKRGYTLAPKV
jgi:hypothetical protein